MDALDLLRTRRSVSAAFLGAPGPDKAQLDEILTIAARVPDHGKLAPWRFIVFAGDGPAKVSALLADLYARKHPEAEPSQIENERKRLALAPVVVAVVSKAAPHVKIPEWEQFLSAGNAAYNLLLAANALGFRANWTTGWIAGDADTRPILGLAPGEKVVAFIHIGTATTEIADRPRPALEDVVSVWQAP